MSTSILGIAVGRLEVCMYVQYSVRSSKRRQAESVDQNISPVARANKDLFPAIALETGSYREENGKTGYIQ